MVQIHPLRPTKRAMFDLDDILPYAVFEMKRDAATFTVILHLKVKHPDLKKIVNVQLDLKDDLFGRTDYESILTFNKAYMLEVALSTINEIPE